MEYSQTTVIQEVSMWILPILFAVTVHEAAHGYVAYLLGDKTAKILGRLTFNPMKHVDIMGTIIIPVLLLMLHTGIVFGWAKPVPVNTRNFHKPKRDMALVALAGPTANFLMVLLWAAVAKVSGMLPVLYLDFPRALTMMSAAGISINLMLMVFNLLPIPPLDGSHIFIHLLPRSIAIHYERIAPYGFFILLILLYVGVISFLVGPVIEILYKYIAMIFGL